MSTLAEFLLARIAEDEADAEWKHDSSEDNLKALEFFGASACTCGYPARVLAECKAKRRIVTESVDDTPDWDRDAGWRRAGLEDAVRLLATVYASHPDYDETWQS